MYDSTYSQSVRAVVAATRGGRMLIIQGCHLGHFFNFIYVIIDVIGTFHVEDHLRKDDVFLP